MTIIRIAFAGHIKKSERKVLAGKPMVEFSLCRKNKTKENEPDAYTWIRVALWEPPEWMAAKIVKGAYISGSGDAVLRSYTDNAGAKATSLDVRCGSFDVDMPDERQQAGAAAPAPAARPAPTRQPDASEEPPF